MEQKTSLSRRQFLKSTSVAGSASLLKIGAPALAALAQVACTARDEGAAFVTLGSDEAVDFAAIAARLIPATETPGAAESGVIWFWDRALGEEISRLLPPVRALREQLNAELGRPFAELPADEQDAALRSVESDPRFELWRIITIFGFFSMAKYGGNKDNMSWDLVGYKGHHGAWTSPFGYYDADAEQANGE